MKDELSGEYWSKRYAENDAGWDMGRVSPPLKEYIDQLTAKNVSILIPGCGNAYEAEYLVAKGFTNVTLIDISEVLVNDLKRKFSGGKLKILSGDFFDLHHKFQLILEQTFFCALDTALRSDYVNKMHELLEDGGTLAGVLFDKNFTVNPPFGGSKDEYGKLFSDKFTIKTMEKCYNSVPPRKGTELFINLKKS